MTTFKDLEDKFTSLIGDDDEEMEMSWKEAFGIVFAVLVVSLIFLATVVFIIAGAIKWVI